MKKTLVFIPIMLLIAFASQAQRSLVYFNWDVNIPTNNTKWLSSTSLKGAKIGYRRFINDNRFSVGLDFAWATYDQYEPTKTVENPEGAITTDYFKYIYQNSFTVSGQYYFTVADLNWLYPYAGLGLGATQNKYRVYYNIYKDGANSWGFLARPEAGVMLRFNERKSFGIMAAVHYDVNTTQNKDYGYNHFSSLGFQLGIMFMPRN